ncbi:hypothetical protein BCR35DRAFT_244746, partial [Leucosporidium creatinivorum]
LLVATARAATHQQPLLAPSAEPPVSSNLIFASFTSLLKQWPNTFYSNGHSVVAGVVPAGTLLYHARKTNDLPPKTEWLAFDAEMSLGIMSGRGGFTRLLTYAASRPLKILYVDGESAALSTQGWLDSQSVLIYGNVTDDESGRGGCGGGEYERARQLCELGDEWGFDGVVRMNTAFELMYCDFSKGLSIISSVNVTDPFTAGAGFGWPAPPDAPYPDPTALQRFSLSSVIFADRSFERSGEPRVLLDYDSFVSFYDPRVSSLAEIRKRERSETSREKTRLLGISDDDGAAVRERVRAEVERMNRKGWAVGDKGGFAATGQIIIDQWASRLGELEYILRAWNGSSVGSENATTTAVRARSALYTPISSYIDFTHYSNTSASWLAWSESRCKTAHTKHVHPPTEGSALVESSIEGVSARLCKTVFRLFAESVLLKFPISVGNSVEGDAAELEERAKEALPRWGAEVRDLQKWLGWTSWVRCEEVCQPGAVCSIPMWP